MHRKEFYAPNKYKLFSFCTFYAMQKNTAFRSQKISTSYVTLVKSSKPSRPQFSHLAKFWEVFQIKIDRNIKELCKTIMQWKM